MKFAFHSAFVVTKWSLLNEVMLKRRWVGFRVLAAPDRRIVRIVKDSVLLKRFFLRVSSRCFSKSLNTSHDSTAEKP